MCRDNEAAIFLCSISVLPHTFVSAGAHDLLFVPQLASRRTLMSALLVTVVPWPALLVGTGRQAMTPCKRDGLALFPPHHQKKNRVPNGTRP